jgi:hemerythrin superfamily protein
LPRQTSAFIGLLLDSPAQRRPRPGGAKIEATDDSQTGARTALLAKLKYALTKHAHEEETVIYPALRQANLAHDSPEWLARVRDFRAMLEEHMRMEEEEVFPVFRSQLSEDQNARLTAMMSKEGFKIA